MKAKRSQTASLSCKPSKIEIRTDRRLLRRTAAIVFVSFLLVASASAQNTAKKRTRVGLALSGGGALGLAHIGVLKYLEEHHIPVDHIAGTSMGGLVGGLYATGQDPDNLERIARSAKWDDLLRASPSFEARPVAEKQEWNRITGEYTFRFGKNLTLPAGINPGQQLALLLSRETLGYPDIRSFDDLPIPFRCVATDLVSGEAFVLGQGSLAKALRATMALPAIFTPVEWEGRILIDGGLVNNLPTDVVRGMGSDAVIAVKVQPAKIDRTQLNTLTSILKQSVNIAVLQNERRNAKLADIVISVSLGDTRGTDFEKAEAIIQSGYRAAQQVSEALNRLAVAPDEWNAYVEAKKARMRLTPGSGPLVAVKSPRREIQQNGSQELFRKSSSSISTEKLEDELTGLTAATGLPSALYSWQAAPEKKSGFRVDLEPRPDRELLLRPSLSYQASGGEPNRFTFRLDSSGILKDAYKSRFLADLFLGYDPGARFEYYIPFNGSSFFVAPGLLVQRTHEIAYNGATRSDSTRDRVAGSFYFGAGTWRFAQLRIGAIAGFDGYSNSVTVDNVTAKNTAFTDPEIVGIFNTQDSGELPTRGTRLNASLGWSFRDHSYPYLQTDFDRFQPIAKTVSVFGLGSIDSSFGRKLTFYDQFTAGGFTNLDAYKYQEFRGNSMFTGGAGVIHRGINPRNLAFRPYLASWYEAGRLDLGSRGWQTVQSTSMGILAPTPVGIMGLSVSFDQQGRARFRLSLGSFWNQR